MAREDATAHGPWDRSCRLGLIIFNLLAFARPFLDLFAVMGSPLAPGWPGCACQAAPRLSNSGLREVTLSDPANNIISAMTSGVNSPGAMAACAQPSKSQTMMLQFC